MKTDNTTLKKLTRGEEEVMQILWQLGAGSINDLIAAMQEPKPKLYDHRHFRQNTREQRLRRTYGTGQKLRILPARSQRRVRQDGCFFDIELLLRRVVGPNGFFLLPARRPFDTRNRTNPRHHPASPT